MKLGWIWQSNLRPFLTELALVAGYPFDDSDWIAVEYGVRGTDSEAGIWFEYPVGRLTAKLGKENGHVIVEVSGDVSGEESRLTWITHIMQNWYLTNRESD